MRAGTRCILIFSFAMLTTVRAAHAADPIPADELSSPDWRDCAGHFFFLSAATAKNDKQEQALKEAHFLAVAAILASETKAEAERKAGITSNGRGRALPRDPKTGKIPIHEIQAASFKQHLQKARTQGVEAYVTAYKAKCHAAVIKYGARFRQALLADEKAGR